ncbi:MAG: oligosaccharide flippase family protein [Anaerolineae bacterium]|nr:oligosaccharide flippase family protein [Anaerolineae bacterium]
MVKRFFKDSAIYGFGKFLVYGIGFFLLPIYTHTFPPAEFGVVDILTNNVARLALVVVALEIAQAVFRFVPETPPGYERRAYSSTALWFSMAAYAIFVAVGWIGADTFSQLILQETGRADVFRVALLMIWANGIFIQLQNQLRLQTKSAQYTLVSVVDTIISLGLTILLIVVLKSGIIGIFWGQLLGLVTGGIVAFYFTREDFGLIFDRAKFREMLRFSLPLVPSSVGVVVLLYVDRVAINARMTIADVGIFGAGDRIASIVTLLMFGFQMSMMPLVYQHYHEPATPRNLARIFRYFVAGALLMIIGLSLFAPELLAMLTTPQYYSAAVVVPLLVSKAVLVGMPIFAPGLSIAKRTGIIALINIAGAVLNVILNLLFIPLFGISGAGLATLISAGTVFGTFMFFSQRHYPVPHTWRQLGLAVVIAAIFIAVGVQIYLPTLPGIALKLVIGAAALGLFFGVGLVEMGDVRLAWQSLRRARVAARQP